MPDSNFFFLPFRLDLENHVLWQDSRLVPLRPKTLAVLRYLVEHAGQLVTRAELSDVVWSTTKVTPQVLRASLWELRQALGDTAERPQFIETVSQQGWRFIASVAANAAPVSSFQFRVPSSDTRSSALSPQHFIVVGREAELMQLHSWLAKALRGERQIVFVTGEPGIGKTALVETFLRSLASRVPGLASSEQQANQKSKGKNQKAKIENLIPKVWLSWGQCIEHYGTGEPYMPVLAALEHLCQEQKDDVVLDLLRRHAPLWLAQMPSLLAPVELADLQRRMAGTTRERMLREMAMFLEALTVDTTLMLVLEDLHWSDPATVNLLAYLARRRDPARLLILGTYRPVDLLVNEHPLSALVQELRVHGQSHEIALTGLSGPAVAHYVQTRFAGNVVPTQLGQMLYERTEGQPFFLVSLTDELVSREVLRVADGQVTWQGELAQMQAWLPESVREFFAQRRARMTAEEEQVLMVASVVGLEFSAALVAEVLALDVAIMEECCEGLVQRRQFLRRAGIGAWPDGTEAAWYGFEHALYQQLWHEQGVPTRHQQWHRQIGTRLEHAYGERAAEIAAELAVHFEQGRDYPRAVRYLQLAGRNAMQRNAPAEAIRHFTQGLELLKTLPATREHAQQEVALQIALGAPLGATKSVGAPEVEQAFSRARELCTQLGASPELIPALWGLCWFSIGQGKPQTARELGEQLVSLTHQGQPALPRVLADNALGAALFWTGEFPRARFSLEQGIALYDPQQHRSPAYVTDLGILCRCYAMLVLWSLGYPDQARTMAQETLTLAHELSHAHSLAQTLCHASIVRQLCREERSARENAEHAVTVSIEQGFPLWSVTSIVMQAWTLAEQGQIEEGVARLHQALTAYGAVHSSIIYPYFLGLLAEAQRKAARPEDGLATVTEALTRVEQTGARYYEAELWRLKGELLLVQARQRAKEEIATPSFPRAHI